MIKRNFPHIVLFFLTLLFVQEALACRCVTEKDLAKQKIAENKYIDDVYFAGVVRITDAKYDQDVFVYKVKVFQSYKGHLNPEDNIYYQWTSCGLRTPKKGGVYKRIVTLKEGKLYFADWCPVVSQEKWSEMEAGSSKATEYLEVENSCKSSGGTWKFEQFNGDCYHATKDEGAVCVDSNECEGFCEVVVDGKTALDLMTTDTPVYSKRIKASGKCSKWKNRAESRWSARDGFLTNHACTVYK